MAKNYSVLEIGTFNEDLGKKGRVMAKESLGLTGAELSFNHLPAGGFAPFVHSHKLNEEIYIIIAGTGTFMVDGEEFSIKEGDVIRVAPEGERALTAGSTDITYICIQVQKDSLTQATEEDGNILTSKASWM